jgi:hypothetical protein
MKDVSPVSVQDRTYGKPEFFALMKKHPRRWVIFNRFKDRKNEISFWEENRLVVVFGLVPFPLCDQ